MGDSGSIRIAGLDEKMYVNQIWGHRIRLENGTAVGRLDDPDWTTIERSIRELDGATAICVELFRVTPQYDGHDLGEDIYDLLRVMMISRGHEGQYTVWVATPGEPTFLLTDATPAEDKSGVTLDTVLVAARSFAETGTLDGQMTWQTTDAADF